MTIGSEVKRACRELVQRLGMAAADGAPFHLYEASLSPDQTITDVDDE